jgi:transposase
MELRAIGIDLGKSIFHLVGVDGRGQVVVRKKLSRTQLLRFTVNLQPCLVGMEASCGANYLGRQLAAQGHDVRLMPAQYVQPFVKSNKNDFLDAEAVVEAVQRPTMRFVPLKTAEQLDLQAFHRVRERLVGQRTAVINQLQAFLLERGLTVRCGRIHLERQLPGILEDADNGLSGRLRDLLQGLRAEWRQLDTEIGRIDAAIDRVAVQDEACRRLATIPGVGPLVATALVAAVGHGAAFAKGRDMAAWLGLVPRQHSTGGRPRLLGISKRGNVYVRRLLITGARSMVIAGRRDRHRFGRWLDGLEGRAHHNLVVVALANKLARIAWAVLTKKEPYRATGVASREATTPYAGQLQAS